MASKSPIKVVSRRSPEYSSNVVLDNVTYHVQTEDLGKKTRRIASRIYHEGEVVYSRDSDYSHILKLANFDAKLQSLMETQHKSTIDSFTREQASKQKQKSHYFEEFQNLLKKGNGSAALLVLEEALQKFPGDPFLLSYYGCLVALVRNNPREGISICLNAIKLLNETMPFGSDFFHSAFYLNLGRAYLKGGKKKEAISAFFQGLKNDTDNRDIHQELVKLGTRRKLPVPFLKRSNPVNKYIGLLLSPGQKK